MSRHLFAVAASLTLTACVYQPPPGYYWGRAGNPYGQAYYPQPRSLAWDAPPTSASIAQRYDPPPRMSLADPPRGPEDQPASEPPRLSFADPPRGPEGGPQSDMPPSRPFDIAPTADPDPPAGGETPFEPTNPRATFAEETADYGVPPTSTLHLHDFDAPTPTHVLGARTITTVQLENMLASEHPPLLVDTIGGAQTVSLPNAVWLRDAGVGRHLDDDIQAWFDFQLSHLTNRDKTRPIVFFCASRMCWLAHNATLRALDLGYTNVYWYRGGRDAWQAAGLPMAPVAQPPS